jgi:hypothetical protein
VKFNALKNGGCNGLPQGKFTAVRPAVKANSSGEAVVKGPPDFALAMRPVCRYSGAQTRGVHPGFEAEQAYQAVFHD